MSLVLGETGFLPEVILDDLLEVPLDVWMRAEHKLTFKKSVIAPCGESGIFINSECGDSVGVLVVNEAVVEEGHCAGEASVVHEPGEEPPGYREGVHNQ